MKEKKKLALARKVGSVTDIYPQDPSLSSNGGDYYFGRSFWEIIVCDRHKVYKAMDLTLHWTSAEFDFDELSGDFCRCQLYKVGIEINGETIPIKYFNTTPKGERYVDNLCIWASEWEFGNEDMIVLMPNS